MLLSHVLIAGGAVAAGVKVYKKYKEPQDTRWHYYLTRKETGKKINLAAKVKRVTSSSSPLIHILRTDPMPTQQQRISKAASAPDSAEISAAEKEANYYIAASSFSLALTTTALIYPALNLASLAVLLYISYPYFTTSYKLISKKDRVSYALLESIGIGGMLLTGHYFAASLAYLLSYSSRKLLLKTEDQTKSNLINVLGDQPRSVWIQKTLPEQEGAFIELEIPFEAVQIGDIVIIQAGQSIPVDGTVTSGQARVDQHALTGESQPVEKEYGDKAFAGTLVLSGELCIKVEKAGTDTVATQIGEILNQTADFKSSIQSRGEKIVDQGASPTLAIGALALYLLGPSSAIAALCAAFGYHMRIAAPISVLNFLRIASDGGILIKDGRSLELLSEIDIVVFDKTGTLTEEIPTVGKIISVKEYSADELLSYAATAEYKQTHPIALAITQEAKKRGLTRLPIDDARYEVGYGLKVFLAAQSTTKQMIHIGSGRFMEMEKITIPPHIKKIEESSHQEGHSLVYIAIDNQLGGMIELVPTIRPEVKRITSELKKRHIGMVIISGDSQRPTQKLAQSLGIDNYFAEVLPQDKATLIKQLQQEGKSVCFIGDGINDSIALKTAQVGISMRGASTIATDTAGIILMDGTLKQFIRLLDIANELDANLTRSTVMTIAPGIICVGGVFFFHFGLISAIMLYNVGLAASVTNALWPLIKHREEKSDTKPVTQVR